MLSSIMKSCIYTVNLSDKGFLTELRMHFLETILFSSLSAAIIKLVI